jgi:hypothetical protein
MTLRMGPREMGLRMGPVSTAVNMVMNFAFYYRRRGAGIA